MSIRLRVSVKEFADAARQLRDGDLKASPLTLALLEHGSFVVSGHTNDQIRLRDISTRQQYSAHMSTELAKCLAAFQRGVPATEDHEFELILVSDEE